MIEKFEVAIVGGGPAGSTCAYELARAGVNVALFDHSHPREKPCGGAISGRIFDELKISENVIERRINWLILESPNGQRVKISHKNAGILVMRKKFDYWLLKRAIKIGAKHIKENVTNVVFKKNVWNIKTNKGTYTSRFLVGADGVNSLVRKTVSNPIPKKHMGHCVGYHITHKSEYIDGAFIDALELYFLGQPYVSIGYAWIFPKFEHITVGIGSKLGTSKLKDFLEYFLKTHSAANRIIKPKKAEIHSYLVPAVSNSKFFDLPTTGKNWVLIGDAAGHVNPVTGEGIYYAIAGGKLAANAYLEGNIQLYEKYWRKKYGEDLYWGLKIQMIFYHKNLLNFSIKIAEKSLEMRKILSEIIVPRKYSYKKIFLLLLPLKFPKIIFESIF